MFTVKYYFKNKLKGSIKEQTQEEAESNLSQNDLYHKSDYYEIINDETNEEVNSGEIPSNEDILDYMFGDEENKEGFNWSYT